MSDSVSKYFERLEDEEHWEQVKLKKELAPKTWFQSFKFLISKLFNFK